MEDKVSVIIAAAGSGERVGKDINKLFVNINGIPVLARTISNFLNYGFNGQVIVVLKQDDIEEFKEQIQKPFGFDNIIIVEGGKDRPESVLNGLNRLDDDTDYVLIQDGARPFTSESVIKDCLNKTKEFGAAVAAYPAINTIKVADENEMIIETPKRADLYEAQTPQGFSYPLIMEANEAREEKPFEVTDDSMILENTGYKVALSKGDKANLKITTPEDIIYARALSKVLEDEE